MGLLNESFTPKPQPTAEPRQSGQTVTNPLQILAIALKNQAGANSQLNQNPLAQAINARRKKKQAY